MQAPHWPLSSGAWGRGMPQLAHRPAPMGASADQHGAHSSPVMPAGSLQPAQTGGISMSASADAVRPSPWSRAWAMGGLMPGACGRMPGVCGRMPEV
jgi:hypothetical protein